MNLKRLQDDKLLRNIFTTIIIIAVYASAIVYMGILKDFVFDPELLTTIGAFSVIAFVGIKSIRWDTTQRAFIDENLKNEELTELNVKIIDENKKIKDDISGQECVNGWNTRDQLEANTNLTSYKLSKLRKRLRKIRVKQTLPFRYRKFSKFETKEELIKDLETNIELLEKNPAVDAKFKPMKYDDIINVSDMVKQKTIPKHKKYNYDPRKDPWWTWVFSIFKFVGISGTAIPFKAKNLDWETLGAFYLALTVTALITVIRRYRGIRRKTGSIYLQIRRDKYNDLVKINTYITDKQNKIEAAKNKADNDKATILRLTKDVVFTMDGTACMVHRLDFVNPMDSIGKYGYGDDYELAYAHMLKEEKTEQFLLDLEQTIRDHFKTEKPIGNAKAKKKEEFVYNHATDLLNVDKVNIRLQNKGCRTSIIKDQFSRKQPIIRVKNKPRKGV
jgi:hypothetical protein